MLKTLKKKFIMAAMVSTTIVLFIIIGGINLANYINVNNSIDSKLQMISDNDGHLLTPDTSPVPGSTENSRSGQFPDSKQTPPDKKSHEGQHFPRETAFDTRYFTVTLKSDGSVSSIDTGKIYAIDTETASEYATSLFSRNKQEGSIDNYKYKAYDSNSDDTIMYIFIDCEREFRNLNSFLMASAGMSLLGLLLVFILVFFLSNRIVKPIAESYAKQKRFITDASHELKTPLTIIDANTEVLEMTTGENEWTNSIRNQTRRLASLTEKLVFLARMDEENVKLTLNNFCISDAIYDSAEPFISVANSKGKELTIDVDNDINYTGDEKNIRQLVSILLDNAIKYSADNGSIKLNFYEQGKNKILTVWNTVDEISPGKLDVLFERFYRTDSSHNSQTGGFGIGLSIALAIVNAHKGKITAKSDDGKSIRFVVTL